MDIRVYQESDIQDVVALWQECGLVTPQNNPEKDIARKLQVDTDLFLVGTLKRNIAKVEDEQIVATVIAGYEGHRGWINYLAVKPAEQRKGFARTMMNAAEKLLLEKGCPKINLQIRASNKAVLAFYNAIGYGMDDVVSMGKRLIPDK